MELFNSLDWRSWVMVFFWMLGFLEIGACFPSLLNTLCTGRGFSLKIPLLLTLLFYQLLLEDYRDFSRPRDLVSTATLLVR